MNDRIILSMDEHQPIEATETTPIESSPILNAAMALWEPLAAFAWDCYLVCGPGVLVVDEQTLLLTAAQHEAGRSVPIQPGYAPLTDIPPGDDFIRIVKTYNPRRQIVLMVIAGEADSMREQLLVLEAGDGGRPTPPECFGNKTM
ncbi:MAG TPA: hypothetical protein PK400_06590 [Phycisphaerales bacterium]|nr:hypothetical protein [Phycisphaerales bacterium]HRQ76301.1 hypothetical protein [Phycisphaerales bacterium]